MQELVPWGVRVQPEAGGHLEAGGPRRAVSLQPGIPTTCKKQEPWPPQQVSATPGT